MIALIPIEQAMPLLQMITECSDWCRGTHPGRLICPQWRPAK